MRRHGMREWMLPLVQEVARRQILPVCSLNHPYRSAIHGRKTCPGGGRTIGRLETGQKCLVYFIPNESRNEPYHYVGDPAQRCHIFRPTTFAFGLISKRILLPCTPIYCATQGATGTYTKSPVFGALI